MHRVVSLQRALAQGTPGAAIGGWFYAIAFLTVYFSWKMFFNRYFGITMACTMVDIIKITT
jgi:hypothetical protein